MPLEKTAWWRRRSTYNGREYKSRDELPAEVRALVDRMPEGLAEGQRTEVKIETVKMLPTEFLITESHRDVRKESGARIAWVLVAILGITVVVLLLLLHGAGPRGR